MKREKILISILGRGKYDSEQGKSDYRQTKYQLPGEEAVESKLVSDVLAQKLSPQKIYIVGTEESLWGVADTYLPFYEKVLIPYGTNATEFWQIFDILTRLEVENREIYFDITHGFRSIPIFVSTILNFFENVKNSYIKGVYYGIYDAQKDDITPVINMLPFLEMNDWIDAYTIFRKYSDGRDIAAMIEERFRLIPDREKKQYGRIQNTAKELDFYSRCIGFSAVKLYIESLAKIDEYITRIDAIPPQLHTISYLLDAMQKEADQFKNLDKTWQQHLKAAKLLFEKNRYAQSLTVLREVIHTYILEELSLEIEDESLRESGIGRMIREEEQRYQREKKTCFLSAKFLDLIGKIRELRNKSNHAFIKKSVGSREIKNSVENLENYLREIETIFTDQTAITDPDALREELSPSKEERHTMLLLFSHRLTPEQEEDARKNLHIDTFIPLPPDLQQKFSNIPADAQSILPYLDDFKDFIQKRSRPGDYILIQGDFGVVCALVRFAWKIGRIPVYSTTEREGMEKITSRGIEKISLFKHVRFRQYEN